MNEPPEDEHDPEQDPQNGDPDFAEYYAEEDTAPEDVGNNDNYAPQVGDYIPQPAAPRFKIGTAEGNTKLIVAALVALTAGKIGYSVGRFDGARAPLPVLAEGSIKAFDRLDNEQRRAIIDQLRSDPPALEEARLGINHMLRIVKEAERELEESRRKVLRSEPTREMYTHSLEMLKPADKER